MFLSLGWRHMKTFRLYARSKSFKMWQFLFSQWSPGVSWSSAGPSLRCACYCWSCDSKCHSSQAHHLRAQAVSDFHWYRNVLWRQPCETASASLATILTLKPLGHERLKVKSFVTWISDIYPCAIWMPNIFAFCQLLAIQLANDCNGLVVDTSAEVLVGKNGQEVGLVAQEPREWDFDLCLKCLEIQSQAPECRVSRVSTWLRLPWQRCPRVQPNHPSISSW